MFVSLDKIQSEKQLYSFVIYLRHSYFSLPQEKKQIKIFTTKFFACNLMGISLWHFIQWVEPVINSGLTSLCMVYSTKRGK